MSVLLERGADANEPDDRGVPPLLYALRAGKRADIPAMRRILVEGGADDEAVRGV